MGRPSRFNNNNNKTTINTSNINTTSHKSINEVTLPPALQHLQTQDSPETPLHGTMVDGPYLTPDTVAGQVKDNIYYNLEAYAENQTSVGSDKTFVTPSGHKTDINLDKNPHLIKTLDAMESQKKGNYGFDPITGASINHGKAPQKGQWSEVKSTFGDKAGSKMWISENKKLDSSGLQNVLNNQAADRHFNSFLKNEWRSVYTTPLGNTSKSKDKWTQSLQKQAYGKIDSWDISSSKKNEFKKDMDKRINNLMFAWNPDAKVPKSVKDRKGPGRSTNENPLTAYGGWDSKKNQKNLFKTGGKLDKLMDPNKSL